MTNQNQTTSTKAYPAPISVAQLRATLKGRVIAPGDAEYDEARTVFIGGIDRRPAVIARVADATDVARVISLARESGQELAVRSGGHSGAGHSVSEGGIVLDLADMRALDIDPQRRTAWAQTGLTAGEYVTTTAAYGLTIGLGDTGSVGIGGLTLGGGVGYLVRKYGLTIDDLLAAEVVTADGQLLRVDAETHPDLFWAIRGGGGNFGVVTRFQFRLHEVDTVVGGMLMLPATPEVIASFIAEAEAAPEELSAIANVMPAPPMPFVPAEHHGRLIIMALMVYAGEVEAGERVLAPFRAIVPPIADMLRPMPYPEIYPPEKAGYHPMAVSRTMFMDTIDRGVAGTIDEYLRASDASLRVAQLRVLGGAMARVPVEATAFAHRRSRIMVNLTAFYDGPEDQAVREAWVKDFMAALHQGDSSVYVNFLADEGDSGSEMHTRGRPGTGSWRSRLATTRPTSSGSTRTSRRRSRVQGSDGRTVEQILTTDFRSRRRIRKSVARKKDAGETTFNQKRRTTRIKKFAGASIWSENLNNLLLFYRDVLGPKVAMESPDFVVLGSDWPVPSLLAG